MRRFLTILSIALAAFTACGKHIDLIRESAFRTVLDGKEISLYTLRGGNIVVQATNYGGRVVSIWTPDRKGRYADVSTGLGSIKEYIDNPGERFLGAAVGPVANRIAKGHFAIGDNHYFLPLNNDGNTLHGGLIGIDRLVWDVESCTDSSLVLSVVHPDGLEGFPGNLKIRMTYTATHDNAFRVDYEAVTDEPTPVNLSNHTFFNLTGDSSKSILNHEIQIFASKTTAIDDLLIPTGEIAGVQGTPLDFREAHAIGERVNDDDPQLKNGHGYDHNWVLDTDGKAGIHTAAILYEPVSGRQMEVLTDQPGIQFYCGNFFDSKQEDKYGKPIGYRCSLALETQKFPDAVNHPSFPDTVLLPGQTYTHTCIYRFSSR